MNTLPQDLTRLIDNHFTAIDDVFINRQFHNECRNIKMAVRMENWKDILYFLQRYEYQDRTLLDCCSAAHRFGNSKIFNIMIGRYECCSKTIWSTMKYGDKSNTYGFMSVKEIKRNLARFALHCVPGGFRQCHLVWVFVCLGKELEILLNETDFSVISTSMVQYCTNNPNDFDTIRCWAAILTLLNRADYLEAFVSLVGVLSNVVCDGKRCYRTMLDMIISASIRTDNLELFIKYLHSYPDNDLLGNIFHLDAYKIAKYVFETYDIKEYRYHWADTPTEDPRIARILVNQKGLKIINIKLLIRTCKEYNYNVVVNILL